VTDKFKDNPEILRMIYIELTTIRNAIYDPKVGMLVRLSKLESTYTNIKWLIILLSIILSIVNKTVQNDILTKIISLIIKSI